MTSIKMLDVKIFLFGCIKISLSRHVEKLNDQEDLMKASCNKKYEKLCARNTRISIIHLKQSLNVRY